MRHKVGQEDGGARSDHRLLCLVRNALRSMHDTDEQLANEICGSEVERIYVSGQ